MGTACSFGFGKLVADARQELRKPVEFMTYTVISAQAFEFHNRNYLSSAIGKTGARNRGEATTIARDRGWL